MSSKWMLTPAVRPPTGSRCSPSAPACRRWRSRAALSGSPRSSRVTRSGLARKGRPKATRSARPSRSAASALARSKPPARMKVRGQALRSASLSAAGHRRARPWPSGRRGGRTGSRWPPAPAPASGRSRRSPGRRSCRRSRRRARAGCRPARRRWRRPPACATSSTKPSRFSTEPPQASVRRLVSRAEELLDQVAVGAVQLDAVEAGGDGVAGRRRRTPRWRARTSASVMARGTGWGCIPLASVYISPGAATALGASTSPPAGRLSGWPTRPVCMSCTKMRPPRACTASVTSFQPATWPVRPEPRDARVAGAVGRGRGPLGDDEPGRGALARSTRPSAALGVLASTGAAAGHGGHDQVVPSASGPSVAGAKSEEVDTW